MDKIPTPDDITLDSLTPVEREFLLAYRDWPDALRKVLSYAIITELLPKAKCEGNLTLLRTCYEFLGHRRKRKWRKVALMKLH